MGWSCFWAGMNLPLAEVLSFAYVEFSLGFWPMKGASLKKAGYTLVEVLVVVTIMGILSAAGVASLRQAIMNNRIKDAALNTTAFLERVATEANKRSATLCLEKITDQEIKVYQRSSCTEKKDQQLVDRFVIESPVKFASGNGCNLTGDNWLDANKAASSAFKPRFGLSAAPSEGFICLQYGTSGLYGAAQKIRTRNVVRPQWKLDVSSAWMDL